MIAQCLNKVLSNISITKEEALQLFLTSKTTSLMEAADQIRKKYFDDRVDLCSIINARSGACAEDCKYCAQSAHYNTGIPEYPLMGEEEIIRQAKENESFGVGRFSIVTSGKALDGDDFRRIVALIRRLKNETKLKLCASIGCIDGSQSTALKAAGLDLLHHNLETSREYFPNTCSTHSYDDRINTVKSGQAAGLDCCCGGIIGFGESPEDRISLAFEVKQLGVKSFPINIHTPIPGTPFDKLAPLDPEETIRTLAIFRFILPDVIIRYAGGRIELGEWQIKGLHAGVNGMMVGNYLTTIGNKVPQDIEMIKKAGLNI